MQTLDRDEVSAYVAAPPAQVYAVIADVTRTPELSPEVTACRWLGGATGAAPGARFEATNRAGSRGRSWRNRPVVTTVEPGREFAFSRTEPFAGTVVWHYRFEPEGNGTRVTESYEVTQPVTRVGWFVIEKVFGCPDRRTELRTGMEETLQRLKALVQEEPAGAPA